MLELDQIIGHRLCFAGNVILGGKKQHGSRRRPPRGFCWWDMNNLGLFIMSSVGLEENGLGNGLQREGKGFLGVAFAMKEASWNPLKHSSLQCVAFPL